MSDRRLEEHSYVCEDGFDMNLSEQQQVKLAPVLAERKRNEGFQSCGITRSVFGESEHCT